MTIETLDEQNPAMVSAQHRAARIHRFGGPDVISIEETKNEMPGDGEVVVRVAAAGVGPWDAWIRAGKSALPQPLPLTLGSDISGVITALGRNVTGFAVGEAVFGVTNSRFTGGYADYAIAAAGMLARKPDALPHIEAASVPVVAVTAWQALFEQAELRQGQSVLIHGAAGNVGAFAVQFARIAGLHVYATTGDQDFTYVRDLGSERVLDGRVDRFEDLLPRMDAVIDLVGGEVQARSFALLRRGGSLISTVSAPVQDIAASHGVRAAFFLVQVTTERLARIAGLIEAGSLKTSVGTVLPLAEAKLAHEMLEDTRPRPRGKIVLRIAD